MRIFRYSLLIISLLITLRVSPAFSSNVIFSNNPAPALGSPVKIAVDKINFTSLILPSSTIKIFADEFIVPINLWPSNTPVTPSITANPVPQSQVTTPHSESPQQRVPRPNPHHRASPSVRNFRGGHQGGTEAQNPQAIPQGASGNSLETTEYFGNLPLFTSTLSHLSTLLGADDTIIALATDLDKTIHYSSNELSDGVNKAVLQIQQLEVMKRFRIWLEELPTELRQRFLFIINTSRIVTMDPAQEGQNSFLYLPEGKWPQEQLSGLTQPDVLISRNGQEFHYFNSAFFRGRLQELVRKVRPCWPPKSSEFTDTDRRFLKQTLGQSGMYSPKCIVALNRRPPFVLLEELATKCGAYMRKYPGDNPECEHIHIYDVRINKGTALLHLLNKMMEMRLFQGDFHFVTAGDDLPDLPMLFPKDYIASLNSLDLQSTFKDTSLPERVLACHAGAVLSVEATEPIENAIKTIQQPGQHVKATLPGLPGIIQKAMEILQERLNTYAF